MPPELMIGKKIGPKVDIWAIGCLMFELISGEKLLPESREKQPANHLHLLALMDKLIRRLPPVYCQVGTRSKVYFDKDGKLKQTSGYELLTETVPIGCLPKDSDCISLVCGCLEYYAFRRPSPRKILENKWLRNSLSNKTDPNKVSKAKTLSDRLLGIDRGGILDTRLNDDSVIHFAESEIAPLPPSSPPLTQKQKKVSQLKIGFGVQAEEDWTPPTTNKQIQSAHIDSLLQKDYSRRSFLLNYQL